MVISEPDDRVIISQAHARVLSWKCGKNRTKNEEVLIPDDVKANGESCGGITPILYIHESVEEVGSVIVNKKNILSHLKGELHESEDVHSFSAESIKKFSPFRELNIAFAYKCKSWSKKSTLMITAMFSTLEKAPIAFSLGYRIAVPYDHYYSRMKMNGAFLKSDDLFQSRDEYRQGHTFDAWREIQIENESGAVWIEQAGQTQDKDCLFLSSENPMESLIVDAISDFVVPDPSFLKRSYFAIRVSFIP